MIWFRKEGERIRNGFNFWWPNDPGSIGFILLLWKYKFNFRWSKNVKRFFISFSRRNPDGYWPMGRYLTGWPKDKK